MRKLKLETKQQCLKVARGNAPADLLLRGGRVVNVFNGLIEERSVAIHKGFIVGFDLNEGLEVYDVDGMILAPGFIDGHIHIESSKLTPSVFARTVLSHGTTAVVADPHEIANVLGVEGIEYMIESSREAPLDFFIMLPACVPATKMETSGAVLGAEALRSLLKYPEVLGVGEVMNFPGAFMGDPDVLEKIALGEEKKPIDGHAPGLSGYNLQAYILAGPKTDHECVNLAEAREKLSLGMRIMIREGSTARNMEELLPLITAETERRCMFVSDDKSAGDLLNQGHLDYTLKKAVALGTDPIQAIRMVTLNTAEAFGLAGRGSIAPGMIADIVMLPDLKDFEVRTVWKDGLKISTDGETLFQGRSLPETDTPRQLNIPVITTDWFTVPDKGGTVRIIELVPEQIITHQAVATLPSSDGNLLVDLNRDIIKISVIERHSGVGRSTTAYLKGMNLKRGAIASTVAHDSHNIIIAGVSDQDMAVAAMRLRTIGGGQVVVEDSRIIAELSLPVAGLMSGKPINEVALGEKTLISAVHNLGSKLPDPFMALSFLALPVIPALKITDMGLVDVTNFCQVSLYIDA